MLPPSMDYEVGKGRIFELEQKAAARRQLEEALAGQRRQQPGLLSRLLKRMKGGVAASRHVDVGMPEPDEVHGLKRRPTAL
jgi:hypothetical protein